MTIAAVSFKLSDCLVTERAAQGKCCQEWCISTCIFVTPIQEFSPCLLPSPPAKILLCTTNSYFLYIIVTSTYFQEPRTYKSLRTGRNGSYYTYDIYQYATNVPLILINGSISCGDNSLLYVEQTLEVNNTSFRSPFMTPISGGPPNVTT